MCGRRCALLQTRATIQHVSRFHTPWAAAGRAGSARATPESCEAAANSLGAVVGPVTRVVSSDYICTVSTRAGFPPKTKIRSMPHTQMQTLGCHTQSRGHTTNHQPRHAHTHARATHTHTGGSVGLWWRNARLYPPAVRRITRSGPCFAAGSKCSRGLRSGGDPHTCGARPILAAKLV